MARRTKEDALVTRGSILDAAEILFARQGVSRTTLQHIASAAGVTRGAIYWHFEDKAALFNAMLERATMPLEAAMVADEEIDLADPLADLRERLMTAFRLTMTDEKTRRVFEIATHRIEYVEELNGVRERHLRVFDDWLVRTERRIKVGIKHGILKTDLSPRAAAIALWAATDGLVRIWLLKPDSFDLLKVGQQTIDAQLDALYAAGRRG
jgi:TetR/AcrR family acrAB operon transcriptional repressor